MRRLWSVPAALRARTRLHLRPRGRTVTIVVAAVLTAACKEPRRPSPPGEQLLVVLDRSTSITPAELLTQQRLLDELAAGLSFDDWLVVQVANANGVRAPGITVRQKMPKAKFNPPRGSERSLRDRARREAADALLPLRQVRGVGSTDLFSTLFVAAERARGAEPRKTTLILVSDMLQCTSALCMEGGAVPSAGTVQTLKKQGLIPSLANVCVSVVGADASTPRGIAVRQFWQAYFSAAGANFSPKRYGYTAPETIALRCSRS